jgi:hypothetical protein
VGSAFEASSHARKVMCEVFIDIGYKEDVGVAITASASRHRGAE